MTTNRTLTIALWAAVCSAAFGLGWALKPAPPQPEQRAGAASTAADSGPVSALTTSGRRGEGGAGRDGGDLQGVGAGARAVPFTGERIAELGERYRMAADPIDRREAFASLIAGLTVENALEIRAQFEHLSDEHPAFKDFHFAWGKIAGADAVVHGADTEGRDMGQALSGWASADPAAARAWFDAIDEDSQFGREHLKRDLVRGMAIADPATAADFALALGAAGDRRAKEMIGVVTQTVMQTGGAARAADWASALPEGDLRGHAMWEVARARVRDDPEAASEWGSVLASRGDGNAGSVAYGVSMEWGHRDGAANVAWLDSLGDNEMTASAYGPALAGWTKRDPMAASEHVLNMPESEGREHAIGGLVYTHRWEDPQAAIAWAGEIADPDRHELVLGLAAEAYLRKDRTQAEVWLPDSGLSAEAQQEIVRRVDGGRR